MKVLFTLGVFALVICSVYGLECYHCNSEDDPKCLTSPTEKLDCHSLIADLPSDRFRCMTIKAGQGAKSFVNRRCTVNDECKSQVQNGKFSWTDTYNDAKCEECPSNLCNSG